jgi:capsular polysaccharide biosynthesis protein
LKLLIQYPNPTKKEFYKFNLDLLNKIIDSSDLIVHDSNNIYENIIVSNSLTHGGLSNLAPRKEIYEIYEKIKINILLNPSYKKYEYIYISRRRWINKDTSNIGTNYYTTRRKMMNEDILVEELEKIGVKEIFAENLTTDEKIQLFGNAKLIIGSIGGGMSNLLFSEKKTKSIIIVTPFFLEINYRFKYSMESSNITYFDNVSVYKEKNEIPLFCRAKIKEDGKIGEIIEYDELNDKYLMNISKNDVAGFNNSIEFDKKWSSIDEFNLLDKGLNSPYQVDIDELLKII